MAVAPTATPTPTSILPQNVRARARERVFVWAPAVCGFSFTMVATSRYLEEVKAQVMEEMDDKILEEAKWMRRRDAEIAEAHFRALERRDRAPPPRTENIHIRSLHSCKDVFKSDVLQHSDPAMRRTPAGPGEYDTRAKSMVRDAKRTSMVFASKARGGSFTEMVYAGQSPRAFPERPLTAEIDFITPNPEILDVVRPVVPSSHGLTWPTFEGRPEPTRDPGLEVLSEAHRRPEGSLLASVASSSRNYMATFSSAQERFAPAAKKEPGQMSTYSYLGTADGMSVREPKRLSSTFKLPVSGKTLSGSASTPALPGAGRRKGRHAEPYGGGDWVVPRAPPLPPRRRRGDKDGRGVAKSASTASLNMVPNWDATSSKGSLSFGSTGASRAGARSELLPEGLYSGTLQSLITY